MSRFGIALVVLALAASPLLAEGSDTAVTPDAAAGPDAAAKHDAAAEELFNILHLDNVMTQTMDVMLKAQLQQHPELVKVEDVMRAFLAKHLSYESMKPDLIRIYTEAFTEAELHEMVAFYRTDTGRKCIDLLPSLLQKGATLGAERVTQHMDELKAALEKRLKELEEKPQPPPATNSGT